MSPWKNENRVSFKTLLNSKLYSDLTLVCDGNKFPVHKAIVCTQSPTLSRACSNANFKEASENVIEVTEFDVDTLYRMLEFLYTGEYTAEGTEHISYEIASASYYSSWRQQDEHDDNDDNNDDKNTNNDDNDGNRFENDNNICVKPEPDFSEWMVDDQHKADCLLDMLHPHIGANAIGDYYLIPALRERANVMIYSILHNSWSAMGFLPAMKQIFEVCGDKELHTIVTDAATKHLDEPVGMEEFAQMSDMPGQFAIPVIQNAVRKLYVTEDKLDWIKGEQRSLKDEYEWREKEHRDEIQKVRGSLGVQWDDKSVNTLPYTSSCVHQQLL